MYQKAKAKHYYNAQKLLGLGGQLVTKKAIAESIFKLKGKILPCGTSKKKIGYIIRQYMEETGIIFSSKFKSVSGDSCVYIIQQKGGEGCIKIGVSDDVEARLKHLQTGSPYALSVIAKIIAKDKCHAICIEKSYHEKLKSYRLNGEWFNKSAIEYLRSQWADSA